ncbi:MAG: matrixin family metalloprotease [Gemmataceae bacterium]
MSRVIRLRLVLLLALVVPGSAVAQVPTYSKWAGSTALPKPQGNSDQGSPLTLTWGFMALGTPINDVANSGFANAPNNLQTRLNTIYAGGQSEWQPLFQSVFDRWSSISGLSYQFEAADDGAAIGSTGFPSGVLGTRADIRIGGKPLDGNSGTLAYNYFPSIGEMVIDTNDSFFADTNSGSIKLRNVAAHEHGHGIGMPHVTSSTNSFLMNPFYSGAFDGPQYHDILAAQYMYGDAREKSNGGLGNDTAARANPLGTFGVGGSTSIGNSARTITVASTATDFVSIDSQTDTDFYKFTLSEPATATVKLEALGFTYNVGTQGGSSVTFDSKSRSNLKLAILAADGTTILAFADATGFGGDETLVYNFGAAGDYYLRVTGEDNPDALALDAQFYGLTLTLTPVPEPATVLAVAGVALGGGWLVRRRRGGAAAPAGQSIL